MLSDHSEAALANYTGQVWTLRSRIVPGDLLVVPLKETKRIAIGRVIGGYRYLADEPDLDRRHVVKVRWERVDLPRTAVKQDLLFTLGSAMSIFAPSKNHAVDRLEHLLATGTDPGQVPLLPVALPPGAPGKKPVVDDDVDEPEFHANIDEVALDQITAKIAEEFSGHGLSTLITEILRAEGYSCKASDPGPDGGIDIVAGRGVLGMDPPRIIGQVKSGGQISAPVVQQLHGAISTQGADQGLLVAWGGLTKPAWDALQGHKLKIRVWEAVDVVEAVLRTYDRLPEEIRTQLPLKRVWMLADPRA